MRSFLPLLFLCTCGAGCRHAPKPAPPPPPAQIHLLTQYPPGHPLGELVSDLNMGGTAVRYRSHLPENRKSAVYFFEEGNLQVEAVKKDGVWILVAVPFLEPKEESVAARLRKWDEGSESKTYEENTGKSTR